MIKKRNPQLCNFHYFAFFVLPQLPQRAVPYLEGDVHIAPLAFYVVGIKYFRIPSFQDAALATSLAIV